MPEHCGRGFDEALLSGYLDGELTQGDEQRVQVHLEDCEVCRATVDEMTQLQGATMSAEFDVPTDDQWSELPRTRASGVSMRLGWSIVSVWLLTLAGYAASELANSDEPLLTKVLVFAGWSGFGLLFLGVVLDRLKSMRTDRYREVRK